MTPWASRLVVAARRALEAQFASVLQSHLLDGATAGLGNAGGNAWEMEISRLKMRLEIIGERRIDVDEMDEITEIRIVGGVQS